MNVMKWGHVKLEYDHDIITHDANSFSSVKLRVFKCGVIDEDIITKLILFDIICFAD